ncbi:hypothetical protein CJ014_00940 [Pleomorphomonas carboxyditropha]|uniref:Uncharacterized protein n=2 Tax=Pleomorphomonas carboxyditropha TaxID=2023338 RepID=A0A2G9X159_9HYPH|nr:hypothetical protein CJ014_00940 [Pleomorphomonas carboxyditropha]
MCRDAIARGEITLKEMANELDVEYTHFKRELNRLLTEAGEPPVGVAPRIYSHTAWDYGIRADAVKKRHCYIGEKIDTTALCNKIDEFLRGGGSVTRIERQTSIAA